MEPKTKIEKEVVKLASELPSITKKQIEWAEKKCYEHTAYCCKQVAWCSDCGHSFAINRTELMVTMLSEKIVCPHCGHELKMKNSRKKKNDVSYYYSIIQSFHGYQIIRHFIISRTTLKDAKTYFSIDECVQNWINSDGKETIIARSCKSTMGWSDNWDFNRPMTIKKFRVNYYSYYNENKYEINDMFIYPRVSIIPRLSRNGFKGSCHDITPSLLIKKLLTDSRTETLFKCRQYSILKFLLPHTNCSDSLWKSIKICIRNNYIIKDASIWYDYFGDLNFLGLDTLNAKFVCPKNIVEAHRKTSKRRNRIIEIKERKQRLLEAMADNEAYIKDKSRYFGLCFKNELMSIEVLQDVEAFQQEGTVMHNCVFSSKYYKKKESLIMHAISPNNENIATVEIDLRRLEILQCRGKCNGVPKYLDEIKALIAENMHQIAEIRKTRKMNCSNMNQQIAI